MLSAPFVLNRPVDGLSISVVTDSGAQSTVGVTDVVAGRLEQFQFQLGVRRRRIGRSCIERCTRRAGW